MMYNKYHIQKEIRFIPKSNDKNNIKSLNELKESQDKYLNEKQKIGLKYYEDIN